MPAKVRIAEFGGGLRRDVAPLSLPVDATPDCANVVFDRGTVRVREGRAEHAPFPSDALVLGGRSLAQYVPPADATGQPVRLITAVGDTLYATDTTDQKFGTYLKMGTSLASTTCKVRFQQFGRSLFFVDGTSCVKKCFNLGGANEDTVENVEPYDILPTHDPTCTFSATGATAYLVQGVWEFGIAYESLTTGTNSTSPLRTYAVEVPDGVFKSVEIALTSDYASPGPDLITLYVKSPAEGVFRHVGSFHIGTSPTPYEATITGDDDWSARRQYPEFVQSPPVGCTHLAEWQNRMVYAAPYLWENSGGNADTLYISNLLDPEHVPQGAYVDPPEDYGTYLRVGTDGQAITALGRIGSYLLVLKRRGAWLLEGSGPSTFSLRQVDAENGCVSQESLAEVENAVLFLGEGTVWRFNGQAFEDAGFPVRSLVRGYTDAQKTGAFAVYDPDARRYGLFFPA